MDGDRIPIIAHLVMDATAANLERVVRPIGPYRFLTKLDVLQAGDLYRNIATVETTGAYNTNWTPIPVYAHGGPMPTLPGSEYIRPLEHAFAIPVFDVQ